MCMAQNVLSNLFHKYTYIVMNVQSSDVKLTYFTMGCGQTSLMPTVLTFEAL